jgi:Beta protein
MNASFGPGHYVPVLKVKRGEKRAVSLLAPQILRGLTPLFEIVETVGKPLGAHLDNSFKDMARALTNVTHYFLDAKELSPEGSQGARAVFMRARDLGVPFVPVTGIARLFDSVEAVKVATHGLGLRLTRAEFDLGQQGGLASAVDNFMREYNLSESGIDLLLDLGAVDEMISDGVRDLASQFLEAIPNKKRWRTLTILGCAFPKSMSDVDRNSHALVDRNEWLVWRDFLYPARQRLDRMPSFGDCAIQHSAGVERFDPRFMRAAAAVRYCLDSKWLLVKGESTGTTSSSVQFPKLARKIVRGALVEHYAGPTHCAGCDAMLRCAEGGSGLGSPEVWRRLGTIHHLTRTTEQIGSLAWP